MILTILHIIPVHRLEQLRHHGLIAVRELAANIAHSMEQTLAEVAAEVRPTDAEREHDPPKDFRNESDHTRLDAHAHETASPHESSSSQGPACAETSHENRNAAEHADRIWAEAAREMSRAVAAILNGDEAARLGALELVSLARKYCSPSHRDSEDVERSRQLYDDLTSRSEAAEDCIAHARSAGAALQEVLEGLAGGCSLQPLMQAFQSLYHEVEAELRTTLLSWLEDVGKVLTQPPPTLVDGQEDLSRLSERAVRQIKSLCDERPTVRQHISQILDSSRSFAKQISQERRLRKILGHSKCLLETICTYIRDQASHGRDEAQQLLHDVLNRLVPALLELIGHIMLPRIEYTSPNLDAALDNFIIESINLMPTDVHVQLSESLYWNSKHQSDLSISSKETRIAASGIGLAFKDISFFVREKVTEIEAPWSDTWCCRPLRKRPVTHEETSHIGAYREHGLLDVGIINDDAARQGAEVDIRLVPCKDQQHANGKPGLFSVERATVSLSADAFLFHLRKTRHKTLNKVLVDPFLVPILRLILQTAASTLLHRALQSLDSSLTRVVRSFKAIEENRSDTSPTWQDYIRAGLKNLVYSQDSEGRQDTEAARAKRASGPSEVNWSIEPEAGVSRPGIVYKDFAGPDTICARYSQGIIVDLGEERRVFVGGQPTLLPTYAQGPATRWKTARQQATAGSPQRALGTLVGSSDASVVSQTQKAAHRVESAINDTRSRFQEFRSEGVVYEDLQAPHQLKHGSPWFHEDFDL